MADQVRPEQLVIAAATSCALFWPLGKEERDTLRAVLAEALPRCAKPDNPALERVLTAARGYISTRHSNDATELRLALGNFFYRRMGQLAPRRERNGA